MTRNFKIPLVYQKMSEKGYTTLEKYLWLDRMEWMSVDKIYKYEYEEGESELIIPFAFTGGGDKWVWVVNYENKEYCVGICYNEEINGIYYAKNTEDAILRQIIEYVSDSKFYINKSQAESYQISEIELMEILGEWRTCFEGILNSTYLETIDYLRSLRLKKVKSQYGEWYALLTLEESNELLNKYIDFELLDEEFVWFTL